MGRSSRPKPARLASKLLHIRTQLGLTQEQMLERLDYQKSPLYASQISDFEQDKREPPLLVLLQYARVAGVPMEALVDDDLKLPERLPGRTGYERIMRRVRAQKRRR
jgi:transcriptional regulator with XRE-family HTH domain